MDGILDELTKDCIFRIKEILSADKVTENFHDYLTLQDNDEFLVGACDENGKPIEMTISKNDQVTILNTWLNFPHEDLTYVPLLVLIGIGDLTIENGFYKVGKGTAHLLYNNYLELVSVDFYVESFHKL